MAEGKQNLQNAAIIAKLFGVTDRRRPKAPTPLRLKWRSCGLRLT